MESVQPGLVIIDSFTTLRVVEESFGYCRGIKLPGEVGLDNTKKKAGYSSCLLLYLGESSMNVRRLRGGDVT